MSETVCVRVKWLLQELERSYVHSAASRSWALRGSVPIASSFDAGPSRWTNKTPHLRLTTTK